MYQPVLHLSHSSGELVKIQLGHDSQAYRLHLAQTGNHPGGRATTTLTLDGQTYIVETLRAGEGWLDIRVSSSSAPASAFTAFVSSEGPKRWVTVNGQTFALTHSSGPAKRGGQARQAAGALTAPMPGQIRAMQVAEGDSVTKGQTLVVVEAMKMEIKIAAPFDGKVKSLKIKPGQAVEKDELLAEIESKMSDE